MNNEDKHIDILFKKGADNHRIESRPADWKRFNKSINKINFWRFSPKQFNIYYLGIVLTGLTCSIIIETQSEKNDHPPIMEDRMMPETKAQKPGLQENMVEETKTEDHKPKPETKPVQLQPAVSKPIEKEAEEPVSSTKDTLGHSTLPKDTLRVTVHDTVVKKVKIIVKDTVKGEKK